jgi:hypothetical protein
MAPMSNRPGVCFPLSNVLTHSVGVEAEITRLEVADANAVLVSENAGHSDQIHVLMKYGNQRAQITTMSSRKSCKEPRMSALAHSLTQADHRNPVCDTARQGYPVYVSNAAARQSTQTVTIRRHAPHTCSRETDRTALTGVERWPESASQKAPAEVWRNRCSSRE